MVKYQRQLNGETAEAEVAEDIHTVTTIPAQRKCFGDGVKVLILGIIIFGVSVAIGLVVDVYYLRDKPRSDVTVITSSPVCTNVVQHLLNLTTNPIDASVAGLLCLTVVAPQKCSLAAGGFILVRTNGIEKVLNLQYGYSNHSNSSHSNSSNSSHSNSSDTNPNVVAVPRLLSGLEKAVKDYGSVQFAQVLQPSIDLATKGFHPSNSTDSFLNSLPAKWRKYFPVQGNVVTSPVLGETLRRINEGKFSLGDELSLATNGRVSRDEYSRYQSTLEWEDPVSVDVAGRRLVSTGPPSSGLFLLLAMNILKQFDGKASQRNITTKVLKSVLKKREELNKMQAPLSHQELVNSLLNMSMAKSFASEIKSRWDIASASDPSASGESSASVSVVNGNGDAASVVCSLGSLGGSKLMTSSGVSLNDGMNFLKKEAGKVKPFTSDAAPLFIVDKQVVSSYTSSTAGGLEPLLQLLSEKVFTTSHI